MIIWKDSEKSVPAPYCYMRQASAPRPFDIEQHKRWVRGLWWVLAPGYVGVVAWLIWRIAAVLRS